MCIPTKESVEKTLRDAVKEVTLRLPESTNPSSFMQSPSPNCGLDNHAPPSKKPRNEIFHCIFGNMDESGAVDSQYDEVTEYLRMRPLQEEESPLRFWASHMSKFPTLYKLARAYLAIPASSAGVERLFSTAGAIGRARRARITTEKMEMLLTNRQYLYNYSNVLKPTDQSDTEVLDIPEEIPEGITEDRDVENVEGGD